MRKITRAALATATVVAVAFSGTTVASAQNANNPFGSSVTTTEYQVDENGNPVLDENDNRIQIKQDTTTRQAPQEVADAWGSMQEIGQSSDNSSSDSGSSTSGQDAEGEDGSSQVPAWVIPVAGVLGALGMLVAVLNFLVPAWSISFVPLI